MMGEESGMGIAEFGTGSRVRDVKYVQPGMGNTQ